MNNIEVFYDEGSINISVINDFEKAIGYSLPCFYRKLLSQHNNLHPENCNFDFFDDSLDRIASRDVTFLGYGDSISESSNIANAQWHDVYGRERKQQAVIIFVLTIE